MDTTTQTQNVSPTSRMERPRDGRIVAGVSLALADRTGIAVGPVRFAFIVAALLGGFGILAYALAWMLLPSADAETSPAERWADDVRSPERRVGAVLIGTALAIVLVPIAPVAVAAAVLLGGAGWLISQRPHHEATPATSTDVTTAGEES